jgi:hypothetical protein
MARRRSKVSKKKRVQRRGKLSQKRTNSLKVSRKQRVQRTGKRSQKRTNRSRVSRTNNVRKKNHRKTSKRGGMDSPPVRAPSNPRTPGWGSLCGENAYQSTRDPSYLMLENLKDEGRSGDWLEKRLPDFIPLYTEFVMFCAYKMKEEAEEHGAEVSRGIIDGISYEHILLFYREWKLMNGDLISEGRYRKYLKKYGENFEHPFQDKKNLMFMNSFFCDDLEVSTTWKERFVNKFKDDLWDMIQSR